LQLHTGQGGSEHMSIELEKHGTLTSSLGQLF